MASTTPVSGSKRKHDDSIPVRIVEDVKRLRTRELSPETELLKDDLLGDATRAIDDANIDQNGHQRQWTLLKKLVDSKSHATDLQQKLEDISSSLNKSHHQMDIGDWAGGIYNIVRSFEKEVKPAFIRELREHFKSTGSTPTEAMNKAKIYESWFVTKGNDCTHTLALLEPELRLVREWRDRDKPIGAEPETPCLDRIGSMRDLAGITRDQFINSARTYLERNELVHHPPPRFQDHPDGEDVNWDSIWNASKEKKKAIRDSFAAGEITEAQKNNFVGTIDAWFNLHVRGWFPGGRADMSDAGERAVKNYKSEKAAAAKTVSTPPPSPYTEGKWDDLTTSI